MLTTPRTLSTFASWFLLLAMIGGLTGCFDRRFDADAVGDGTPRPTDLFRVDAAPPPACGAPDPSPLSALQIRVRTSPIGGRFAPRNVGAIWIEDWSGSFVKTVARWGKTRAKWLLRFNASAHENVVDAITGATLLSHEAHDVTWNLTDVSHCEIAAGDYQVVMEHTDRDGAGVSLAIPFHKDQSTFAITSPETLYFHDIALTLN